MAGLPELNGIAGTFSGTGGLDLSPLVLKQRSRMFQQQLAQEAARLAQQDKLASRGLDLQERGQDIGVSEADLARKFAENLQGMRQEFDASQQQRQIQATTANQQRAIEEAQRSQGAAQDFAGQQSELQRGFVGGQNEADRSFKREALDFDKDRFEATFGLESDKFNFQKEVTLNDQSRQERADELKQQMFELQKQEFGSQAEQRSAQVKLVEMQTELYAQQLADAREEVAMTGDETNQIIQAAADGDVTALSGNLLKKVMGNKKSRDAVFGLIDLVKSSQEIGLVNSAIEKQKAGPGGDGGETPGAGLSKSESDLRDRVMLEEERQGVFTFEGARNYVIDGLNELESLRGSTDEKAQRRVKKIEDLLATFKNYESALDDEGDAAKESGSRAREIAKKLNRLADELDY